MAGVQWNYTNNIPKSTRREETSITYRFRKRIGDFDLKASFRSARLRSRRSSKRARGSLLQCCSTSVSSSSTEEEDGEEDGNGEDQQGQFGYFVKEYGWMVRRMREDDETEVREVAYIQSQAFYEPKRFFDDFFFELFQAEVLSGLLYRLRNSSPDRYACLVAERNTESRGSPSSKLVGVVDVTALKEDGVLHHLPIGAQEYLYISGIAVLNDFRRKKVATVLLKACDVLSSAWGFEHLVLRAYEDDLAALKLYKNAGYDIVSGDPPWMSAWIGRRRRVLMVRQSDYFGK